jgi:hypothetical protein
MSEREETIREQLESTGIFDFPALYQFAHSWLKGKEYAVDEEKYSERVGSSGRDIRIEWKATRLLSDYFKIEHKIFFEIEKLTDVEVEIDGVKKKMNKGKVKMEVKTALIRDWNSKWEAAPITKFLRDVYNKYVIPSRVDSIRDKSKDDCKDFKEELKSFLELYGKR